MANVDETENSEIKSVTETAFLEKGKCSDEITFEFEDDKKLFVSQNLLKLVSPVFEAMFNSEHTFKESQENTVKIVDFEIEDFRNFLLCIHPDIQQPITDTNFLSIASIADKYQTRLIISRCKDYMVQFLHNLPSKMSFSHLDGKYQVNLQGLEVLHKALELNYEQVVAKSITAISRFGSKYFTGSQLLLKKGDTGGFGYVTITSEEVEKEREKCRELFQKLSPTIKERLYLARLERCDGMETK